MKIDYIEPRRVEPPPGTGIAGGAAAALCIATIAGVLHHLDRGDLLTAAIFAGLALTFAFITEAIMKEQGK